MSENRLKQYINHNFKRLLSHRLSCFEELSLTRARKQSHIKDNCLHKNNIRKHFASKSPMTCCDRSHIMLCQTTISVLIIEHSFYVCFYPTKTIVVVEASTKINNIDYSRCCSSFVNIKSYL